MSDTGASLYAKIFGQQNNLPVPTGNLPVPTGNLPVPLQPISMEGAGGWNELFGGMGQKAIGTGSGGGGLAGLAQQIPQESFEGYMGSGSAPPMYDNVLNAGIAGGAEGGLISQLLGKIPAAFPGGTAGKVGFGIGLPIAGQFLGNAAGGDKSIVGRFIKGAGTGGGIGAMFGPEGSLIGGAALGVLDAVFGGKGGGGPEQKLNSILASSTMPDSMKSQYRLMFNVLKQTSDEKTALATVGQQILAGIQSQQQLQDQQSHLLASQALAAQFFQPFTKQIMDSANLRSKLTEQLGSQLPAPYAAVSKQSAVDSLDNATKVATAYQAQAQLLPALEAIQTQQGLVDQVSQQRLMQALSGTGATSLAGLAQQLQGSPTGQ